MGIKDDFKHFFNINKPIGRLSYIIWTMIFPLVIVLAKVALMFAEKGSAEYSSLILQIVLLLIATLTVIFAIVTMFFGIGKRLLDIINKKWLAITLAILFIIISIFIGSFIMIVHLCLYIIPGRNRKQECGTTELSGIIEEQQTEANEDINGTN